MQDFNFDDLAPKEIRLSIGGKKHLLREASGDAACKYRNAIIGSTRLGPDGKPTSIHGLADAEPMLVSLCLFELYEHQGQEKERPVLLSTIRGWPARVLKPLVEKVKEISPGLEDRPDESEDALQKRLEETQQKLADLQKNGGGDPSKNSLSATTVGSV